MDTLFCPILKKECIGKNCAMAIKLDHFTISAYEVPYQCGLIVTHDSYSFGKPQYIDCERKKTQTFFKLNRKR